MPKKSLDAHPSVVVAYYSEIPGKFLMSIYDQGYPKPAYRGSANNIGGNPEPGDTSPEQVLLKEIAEEFDPNHPYEKKFFKNIEWASDEDIRSVRNSLLGNVKPFQDFYVVCGQIEGGNNPYSAIYSAFCSYIPKHAIDIAEKNLRENRHLTTEGLVGVFSPDELRNSPRGEFSTAHATAPIINHLFSNSSTISIPGILYPKALVAEPIGKPRKSFNDYLADFEYSSEKLRKASRAET